MEPNIDSQPEKDSARTMPVRLSTKTSYKIPSDAFMLPTNWKRFHLSELINKVLALPNPIPFDFIVNGSLLSGTLEEWCKANGANEEETLEIEYVPSARPPESMSSIPQHDWTSSVSFKKKGFILTGSYNGQVQVINLSQEVVCSFEEHQGPVSAACWVGADVSEGAALIASSSYDTTARLTSVSHLGDPSTSAVAKGLASLRLHNDIVSSISANAAGSLLLTASHDNLVGLWDTSIPTEHETLSMEIDDRRPLKKRRKVAQSDESEDTAFRKAPRAVLNGHTAKVSNALFSPLESNRAFSVGWDCTLRAWDLELGVCSNTTISPERVMLTSALSNDGRHSLVACADRHVLLYSSQGNNLSAKPDIVFPHSSVPVALACHPVSPNHFLSGSQDSVVRIWDIRSNARAIGSFVYSQKEGDSAKSKRQSLRCLDWGVDNVAAVGGEGDLEITRAEISA